MLPWFHDAHKARRGIPERYRNAIDTQLQWPCGGAQDQWSCWSYVSEVPRKINSSKTFSETFSTNGWTGYLHAFLGSNPWNSSFRSQVSNRTYWITVLNLNSFFPWRNVAIGKFQHRVCLAPRRLLISTNSQQRQLRFHLCHVQYPHVRTPPNQDRYLRR